MSKWKLYNVAKQYIRTIEQIERTPDAQRLADLEESRVIWHNRIVQLLRREGILFRDREHVTRIAYRIIRDEG